MVPNTEVQEVKVVAANALTLACIARVVIPVGIAYIKRKLAFGTTGFFLANQKYLCKKHSCT